ncbi:MAG: molybdopterin-dependent oxidoreductase [Devosia sp.]
MKRRQFLGWAAVAAAAGLACPTLGQDGQVILEVSGNVEATRSFTLAQLQSLGVTTIATTTAWTDGTPVFEGVLARDVIAAMGPISSDHVTALALNDYQADIPMSDFIDYDVIFAWSMDGQMLSRRDKGPLWVVYPRDTAPVLSEERYEHRWVWQLNRLQLP